MRTGFTKRSLNNILHSLNIGDSLGLQRERPKVSTGHGQIEDQTEEPLMIIGYVLLSPYVDSPK